MTKNFYCYSGELSAEIYYYQCLKTWIPAKSLAGMTNTIVRYLSCKKSRRLCVLA
jgi:hypothetical protein